MRYDLLVWRPNLETGKLEDFIEDPWAEELHFEMGSRSSQMSGSKLSLSR